ncbi:hypothetical protein CEXT_83871 [Caerostris extrusa]|uniref:Uncharacterized protein n=1 Tax=Caerostris extrusa TaxID=172846 RepID=A0AAV4R283_CAEEX|nr:hypothetical protein CEXT_83871 [Caerostris extrusa]
MKAYTNTCTHVKRNLLQLFHQNLHNSSADKDLSGRSSAKTIAHRFPQTKTLGKKQQAIKDAKMIGQWYWKRIIELILVHFFVCRIAKSDLNQPCDSCSFGQSLEVGNET